MSKRGRRSREMQQPHKDKYADESAAAQRQRRQEEAEWARNNPATSTEATASPTPEGQEVA